MLQLAVNRRNCRKIRRRPIKIQLGFGACFKYTPFLGVVAHEKIVTQELIVFGEATSYFLELVYFSVLQNLRMPRRTQAVSL